MIGVLLRFQYQNEFNEALFRQVAETAQVKFNGMPGLRSKAFMFDVENREALSFYIWDSEDAARAFFSPQLVERVAELYGVRPTLQFTEFAALVENQRT